MQKEKYLEENDMGFRKYDIDGKVINAKTKPLDCQKAVELGEKVLVEQTHKDEVDINRIVARHGMDLISKTNQMQQFRFDDVTNNDFQEVMNFMLSAAESFESIPKEVRKMFDNDPAKFVDYAVNPDNHKQMQEWGLADKDAPPPDPIQVLMVNPVTKEPDMTPGAETPPA